MEFTHRGDVLHPSPGDVEKSVAAAPANSTADVLESARKRRPSLSQRLRSGSGEASPSEALADRFQPAPAFALDVVQARQVCGGPLWCVAAGGRGLVACGGSDGVVRALQLGAPGDDWRLPRDGALTDLQDLAGHEAAVFGCAFSSQEDATVLVTVSADATARLWRGPPGEPRLDCQMVFAHGQAVCCCAWLDEAAFLTGGFDRNVRAWHVPSRKATAWAHLNDAVTAVGCRPGAGAGQPARVAVGTRGGQVFVYKSRDHAHLECDEMVLGTMRTQAFAEAERCGAAGVASRPGALDGLVGGSAKPKASKPGFFGRFFRSRKSDADRAAESEARAEAFLVPSEDTKVDDAAESDDDDVTETPVAGDLQEAATAEEVSTPAAVAHRATSCAFGSGDALLVCQNNGEPALFDAAAPQKPAVTTLKGGVRAAVGCGAAVDERGAYAVGGSECGRLLVWRLEQAPQRPEALALELDVGARNARVAAVTAACFAPAAAAARALGAGVEAYGVDAGAALIVAADYSGRLLVAQREPVASAAPASPAEAPSASKKRGKRPSLPGQAYAPGATP